MWREAALGYARVAPLHRFFLRAGFTAGSNIDVSSNRSDTLGNRVVGREILDLAEYRPQLLEVLSRLCLIYHEEPLERILSLAGFTPDIYVIVCPGPYHL